MAVLFLTRARPRPAPRKPIPRVGATVCESLDKNAASGASSEGLGGGRVLPDEQGPWHRLIDTKKPQLLHRGINWIWSCRTGLPGSPIRGVSSVTGNRAHAGSSSPAFDRSRIGAAQQQYIAPVRRAIAIEATCLAETSEKHRVDLLARRFENANAASCCKV
jgi:hypothetical protein